jgi:hypothetical protein
MGTKIIEVEFTDGTKKKLSLNNNYPMGDLARYLEKTYPDKKVATVDGQPLPQQGASVTPADDVDAGKIGNTIGKGLRTAGGWAKDAAIDTGSAIGRGTWGFLKGVAGYDESVKAQDDAVLERIKNIKY